MKSRLPGLGLAAGAAMLVAAGCYAISSVTVRVVSRTDSTQAIVFWLVTMLAIGAGGAAIIVGSGLVLLRR